VKKLNYEIEATRKKMLESDSLYELIYHFYDYQPFYYDEKKIYWLWDKEKNIWYDTDFTQIMVSLIDIIENKINLTSSRKYNEVKKLVETIGRKNKPKEAPLKWIQFNKKAYSIKSLKIYDITSEYFFTNCIPWDIGETSETPVLDKYFKEWVGEEYVQTLYEIIAYCCYRDYPIQVLFCFFGGGTNGKSTFMNILRKFLGDKNHCTTSIEALGNSSSRFESYRLYKKLYCQIGETNKGVLTQTDLLKRLVGNDPISYEKKNCNPFTDINYAKILIGSNSLPISQDETDGFYRRWFIIQFPNQFIDTGEDIINSIPDKEFNNLAKKCMEILPRLIKKKKFDKMGTIEDRRQKYIQCSNPLMIFLNTFCEKATNDIDITDTNSPYFILYNTLFNEYIKYLKYTGIKKKFTTFDFSTSLNNFGILIDNGHRLVNPDGTDRIDKYKSGKFVVGYKFKDDYEKIKQF
jgi:P4 family phage/plasmid primase-like protien